MPPDQRRRLLQLVPNASDGEPTDTELSLALIAGHAWAPPATWNRFAPMVYGIACRSLGPGSDAEDVTQEVFYRLFMKIGTLRQPEALRSFVTSFALRIVKWELRRRRTRRWLTLFGSDSLPDAPVVGGDAEGRHALERFYVVLDRLGARERLVFTLRHVEEMKLEEIAAAIGVSLSTVKRTLIRAQDRLSRWLERDPDLAGYFEGRRRRSSDDDGGEQEEGS